MRALFCLAKWVANFKTTVSSYAIIFSQLQQLPKSVLELGKMLLSVEKHSWFKINICMKLSITGGELVSQQESNVQHSISSKQFGCQGHKWINEYKWIKPSLETTCGPINTEAIVFYCVNLLSGESISPWPERELARFKKLFRISKGGGECGMNLLLSDSGFHRRGFGAVQPLVGCGRARWKKPGSAVELLKP